MNKNDKGVSRQSHKGPSLSSLVQLKLIESSHQANNQLKLGELFLKPPTSIINTPSTIADLKKFHSCDLNQKAKQASTQFLPSESGHRRCESATKILTLHEIKKEEGKSKGSEKFEEPKSSSRKLFVSISRKSERSESKKKEADP
jgi:hypothetical protein